MDQWTPERSAYELELLRLLDSRIETRGLTVERCHAEYPIHFDKHGGEPRNADMAFVGTTSYARIAATIEAKADEPFGGTVAETFSDALERRIENPRSRGIERITDLASACSASGHAGVRKSDALDKLLTAAAGSLAYAIAEAANTAILVIHEFRTCKTDDARHRMNALDLDEFLFRLGGAPIKSDGLADSLEFAGPLRRPGCTTLRLPSAAANWQDRDCATWKYMVPGQVTASIRDATSSKTRLSENKTVAPGGTPRTSRVCHARTTLSA